MSFVLCQLYCNTAVKPGDTESYIYGQSHASAKEEELKLPLEISCCLFEAHYIKLCMCRAHKDYQKGIF